MPRLVGVIDMQNWFMSVIESYAHSSHDRGSHTQSSHDPLHFTGTHSQSSHDRWQALERMRIHHMIRKNHDQPVLNP